MSPGRYHFINWHPLLMTFAFIFFYMEGALAYRLLPASLGIARKWVHGIMMCVIGGLPPSCVPAPPPECCDLAGSSQPR